MVAGVVWGGEGEGEREALVWGWGWGARWGRESGGKVVDCIVGRSYFFRSFVLYSFLLYRYPFLELYI